MGEVKLRSRRLSQPRLARFTGKTGEYLNCFKQYRDSGGRRKPIDGLLELLLKTWF
jgi:hypothetical protein